MEKKGLNVAVLGLGRMGLLHAAAYAKMPLVNLKAICDVDEARLAKCCKEFGAEGYSDFNKLLEDDSIDAVNICLPDNMHLAPVKKALDMGKHILCEKPLANTLAETKEIRDYEKGNDKVFMVGYTLRFSLRHLMVKDYYDKGEFGEVIMVHNRRSSPIIGPRHYAGYSDLADHVMIHDIAYFNWLFGTKPSKLFAKGRSVMLKDSNMTDVIYAILEYPNGAMVCLESCWVLPELTPQALDDTMELIGTKGSVYMSCGDLSSTFVMGDRQALPKPVYSGIPFDTDHVSDIYFDEITFFVNCILNGQSPGMSCDDAVADIEVVEAIMQSIAEGREIELK